MRTLFHNGKILTLTGGTAANQVPDYIPNGCFGVEDDRIAFVAGTAPGEGGAEALAPAGWRPGEVDRVVDLQGRLAMPGLVNAHTHAAMTLFRGHADDLVLQDWLFTRIFPMEEKLTGEDVYWGTLLALAEMTRAGVTAFADMYFFMDDAARATAESGMRGCLARGLVSQLGQAGLDDSRRFFHAWHGEANGRITVFLGPHAVYTCTPEYLRQVADLAGELGTGIHIHLAENRQEVEQCCKQHGVSPVRLARDCGLLEHRILVAHAVHPDRDDLAMLARIKGAVVHNPLSNQKLASGIAPVEGMVARGIPVALGTDGAASSNALDLLEAARHAALLQKVQTGDAAALPAPAALRMASRAGAEALGLTDTGTLAPGQKADFVVVETGRAHLVPAEDPYAMLVYAARADDIVATYVDGRPLMEERRLLVLDEERILYEAKQRSRRLVA